MVHDDEGVAKIDRRIGEIVMRTISADQMIADLNDAAATVIVEVTSNKTNVLPALPALDTEVEDEIVAGLMDHHYHHQRVTIKNIAVMKVVEVALIGVPEEVVAIEIQVLPRVVAVQVVLEEGAMIGEEWTTEKGGRTEGEQVVVAAAAPLIEEETKEAAVVLRIEEIGEVAVEEGVVRAHEQVMRMVVYYLKVTQKSQFTIVLLLATRV